MEQRVRGSGGEEENEVELFGKIFNIGVREEEEEEEAEYFYD